VLSNLLSNAIRHAGSGGAVSIAVEPLGDRMVVRVADTGPGISPQDLPKIFDRFHKGRASSGSGLGLTIARNLVVAHGGEIRAESQLGQGTTMVLTLPLGANS
jgi:signal transduction histidine kinase